TRVLLEPQCDCRGFSYSPAEGAYWKNSIEGRRGDLGDPVARSAQSGRPLLHRPGLSGFQPSRHTSGGIVWHVSNRFAPPAGCERIATAYPHDLLLSNANWRSIADLHGERDGSVSAHQSTEGVGQERFGVDQCSHDCAIPMRFLTGFNSKLRHAVRCTNPGILAYYWEGGTPSGHPIKEISSTGAFITTSQRWYIGTILTLTLQSDAVATQATDTLTISCRVARHEDDGVGVSFLFTNAQDRKALEKFVRRIRAHRKWKHARGNGDGQALIEYALVV